MLSFSRDPKGYIQDLLRSQSRDLKVKGASGGAATGHLRLLSFPYRSSSAGRSWSSRWSYATPRRAGESCR